MHPLPPELRHRRWVVTMELAETWSAWGRMSADESDRMIEQSRRSACSEPREVEGLSLINPFHIPQP